LVKQGTLKPWAGTRPYLLLAMLPHLPCFPGGPALPTSQDADRPSCSSSRGMRGFPFSSSDHTIELSMAAPEASGRDAFPCGSSCGPLGPHAASAAIAAGVTGLRPFPPPSGTPPFGTCDEVRPSVALSRGIRLALGPDTNRFRLNPKVLEEPG
jgi:hypothetical protein